MALSTFALLLSVACVLGGKGVFEATDKNFDSDVLGSGKAAFVKFLAPWWGHCKNMKPDWDNLGKKYADSNVMIVDVDCTAQGQGTCQKMGVKGYPTIKYFLPNDKKGKDYQGGRDLNSLTSFVDSTLNKASCDALTKKDCKPNEVAFIEKQEGKSAAELEEELTSKEAALKQIKKDRSAAKKEFEEKDKELSKQEKLTSKAIGILKQLQKAKK